jgi:WD40 repeat protein
VRVNCRVLANGFHVDELLFAPDGNWLAGGGSDGVRIWQLTDDGRTGTLPAPVSGRLAVAPDAGWVVTEDITRSVRLWDTATGQVRAVLNPPAADYQPLMPPTADFVVAPDGSWLATGPSRHVRADRGPVRIWDTATGAVRAVLDVDADRLLASRFLVTVELDGTVRAWDPYGAPLGSLPGDPVDQLVCAPDGAWLAVTDEQGTLRIWQPHRDSGRTVLNGHTGAVRAVAVAPDGGWLVTAGVDRTVRIWDAPGGTCRTQRPDYAEWVDHIAIPPDGSWLATAGKDLVRIWDPATGEARPEQPRHPEWVSRLVASADGTWLVSVDHSGTVRVWDAATGAVRAEEDTDARHGLTQQPAVDPHHVRWATTDFDEADGHGVLLWETG